MNDIDQEGENLIRDISALLEGKHIEVVITSLAAILGTISATEDIEYDVYLKLCVQSYLAGNTIEV